MVKLENNSNNDKSIAQNKPTIEPAHPKSNKNTE